MDNTSLYTTRGTSYESARPGYPDELMHYLYEALHFDKANAIADVGSGTGKFTRLLLEWGSRVYAVEPNEEMISLRVQENSYTLVPQGAEYLSEIEDSTFDVVLCHNVLEYVEDAESVLNQLVRVLKPGGILSVVKHNDLGRVVAYAVLNDDPRAALDLLCKEEAEDSMFGSRNVYDNGRLVSFLADWMELADTYGIRTFFGLSSNNEIKYTDEWYRSMLELETKAGTMDEYRKIAFFNHLIFRKKPAII